MIYQINSSPLSSNSSAKGFNIKKEYGGDLDLIYASDEEGNSYHTMFSIPTPISIQDYATTDYLESEDLDFEPKKPNALIIN